MIKEAYRFLSPRFQNLFSEYHVDLRPRYGHGLPPHPGLYEVIEAHRSSYVGWIEKAMSYREQIWQIPYESQGKGPFWNNHYFPGLDIAMLYSIIRDKSPKRYVEVGSGTSTLVTGLAKQIGDLDMRIVSIDPNPRLPLDDRVDERIAVKVENLKWDWSTELDDGDVLFIDNSHRIMPNSDAMVFFLEILPALKPGVLVHIHDIYLPYDYPQFMCERFYSEQYGLAINLLANPVRYKPLLANYFIHCDTQLNQLVSPMWEHPNLQKVERHGGSFWLTIGPT